MSTEREAFKALVEERRRHIDATNTLVSMAIREFFADHPCVAVLNTDSPMSVIFNTTKVDAEELAKLSKCLKAMDENVGGLRKPAPVFLSNSMIRPVSEHEVQCPTCDGTGEVHSHNPKCWSCHGTGKVTPEKAAEIELGNAMFV